MRIIKEIEEQREGGLRLEGWEGGGEWKGEARGGVEGGAHRDARRCGRRGIRRGYKCGADWGDFIESTNKEVGYFQVKVTVALSNSVPWMIPKLISGTL